MARPLHALTMVDLFHRRNAKLLADGVFIRTPDIFKVLGVRRVFVGPSDAPFGAILGVSGFAFRRYHRNPLIPCLSICHDR